MSWSYGAGNQSNFPIVSLDKSSFTVYSPQPSSYSHHKLLIIIMSLAMYAKQLDLFATAIQKGYSMGYTSSSILYALQAAFAGLILNLVRQRAMGWWKEIQKCESVGTILPRRC
jgi:hypothetical protein